MRRMLLLVEGQTEETFVRELLAPHFSQYFLSVTPIIVRTSPGHKGGVTNYGKVQTQVKRLCKQEPNAVISTIIDLYGLPSDFPGRRLEAYRSIAEGEQKAIFLEKHFADDIDQSNFIPYFMLHEFEALLFVKPDEFGDWTDSPKVVDGLTAISQRYKTPEHINDGLQSAPSKRILALMPAYKKTIHGPLIALAIGLDALRRGCPHFNNWLTLCEMHAI